MKKTKLVRESLNEVFTNRVNLKNEMSYYSDYEDSLNDEINADIVEYLKPAIEKFGVEPQFLGTISSYGAWADWEDIKNEFHKRQIQYYEVDLSDGESVILFDYRELDEELDE